jgi:capsule polysaccharide export protein KpsE/RkpR
MEIDDPDPLVVKENALNLFRDNIRNIGYNEETGVIKISIETKDKYLSTDIANYYWQKLEKYNLETRMSKGRQKRVFLEARVNRVQAVIDSLSQNFLSFQKENNVILLDEQTKVIVKQYSELITEKYRKDLELELARSFSDSNNPGIKKLILENQVITKKIFELENIDTENFKYVLSLESIPDKAYEYANLKMNLELQEKIFSFIYPQYEQAKIEEIKDLPTIEIIDKAVPAGLRSKPKRARFCIVAFFMAIILSSILVYIYNHFYNLFKTKS